MVCRFPDSVDAVSGKGLGLSDLMHSAQVRSVLFKTASLLDGLLGIVQILPLHRFYLSTRNKLVLDIKPPTSNFMFSF